MEVNKNFELILSEIWLEQNESKLYLASLKVWTSSASILAKMTNIPRTTARYNCEQLVKKQIMIESMKWNTKFFTPEHPTRLKNLLIIQKNELEEKEDKIDLIMQDLIKMKNPYSEIPKVTYYEWIDWIKKVLWDSLEAKEIVDSYTDVDSVIKYLPELNKEYSEKRSKLWIKKRAIYSNSEDVKKYIQDLYENKKDELNQIRFLDPKKYNLDISFMIYDWKITYITVKENNFLWIIIENKDIYNFHKNIFNFMWSSLDK